MSVTTEKTYADAVLNAEADMISIANEYSLPTDSSNQHDKNVRSPFDYIMVAYENYIDDGGELSPDCTVAYVKDNNWFSMSDANDVDSDIDVNIAKQGVVLNIIRSDVQRINDAAHRFGMDYVRFGIVTYNANTETAYYAYDYKNTRPDGTWFVDYAVNKMRNHYDSLMSMIKNNHIECERFIVK